MKKLLLIFMILIMAISLIACSSDEGEDAAQDATQDDAVTEGSAEGSSDSSSEGSSEDSSEGSTDNANQIITENSSWNLVAMTNTAGEDVWASSGTNSGQIAFMGNGYAEVFITSLAQEDSFNVSSKTATWSIDGDQLSIMLLDGKENQQVVTIANGKFTIQYEDYILTFKDPALS